MRIMIADSHPEVRAAMRLLLEEDSATWIVASEASSAIELINKTRSANPRVILVDWDLPGLRFGPGNFDFQRTDKIFVALRAIAPKAKVLVLGTLPESKTAVMQAGADAFICKSESPQQLLGVIKELEQGLASDQPPSWTTLPNIPIEPSQ